MGKKSRPPRAFGRQLGMRLDRLRWKRRGKELQKQLCSYFQAKELRERETMQAAQEASRAEARRRRAAKEHAERQRAKVREWCQRRTELEVQEAEEQRVLLSQMEKEEEQRYRLTEEQEVVSMATRVEKRQRIVARKSVMRQEAKEARAQQRCL